MTVFPGSGDRAGAADGLTEAVGFLVSLFVITWTWGLLAAPPLLTAGSLAMFLVGLLPSVWTPTLLAIGFTLRHGGVSLLRRELRARLVSPSAGVLLTAIALPLTMVLTAIVAARYSGDSAAFVAASALPVAIAIQAITGATGEELGWRGYLLPRLAHRFGSTAAIFVMSACWALWHLPSFFVEGMPHQAIPLVPFLVFVALFGVTLGSLFFAAGQSIIPTIVAHLVLNIMLAIGGASITSLTFWLALDATAALFAVVVLLGAKRTT